MNEASCEYGKHRVKTSRMSHYWDDDHGLPEKGVKTCVECYSAHILKYYPDSKIANHIRANPNEYKNNA